MCYMPYLPNKMPVDRKPHVQLRLENKPKHVIVSGALLLNKNKGLFTLPLLAVSKRVGGGGDRRDFFFITCRFGTNQHVPFIQFTGIRHSSFVEINLKIKIISLLYVVSFV